MSEKPKPVKVGVVGCGNISTAYFEQSKLFPILEVVACADLNMELARTQGQKYNIANICTTEELMANPEVEIVLNITTPAAHAPVALAAIANGKAVYNEKPLATNREDGAQIIAAAKRMGVLVGCAPDTFLGGGLQTCRKLVDDGWIGEPVAATAFMMSPGHELVHPNPNFFYQPGAGPLFDMGPYYLTALVMMMGPVHRVSAMQRITFVERTIVSQPYAGTKIHVSTPTHITGLLEFVSGALATLIMTFDVKGSTLPRIEIYGSQATLVAPDPNTFGGPVRLRRLRDDDWREIPLTHGYTQRHRSLGLADMAHALRSGRPHRANGDLAFHVLDIMHAFTESAKQGKHIDLTSTCERPTELPLGLSDGELLVGG